jgi:glycosyltransferase involved in cell wall biosynthesis
MLNNTSCFPEIACDAAIYFKMSKESSDFEEQFETLYHLNTNERESLLNKQRQRMQMFSWKKAAKQLADVYQNVMSRK